MTLTDTVAQAFKAHPGQLFSMQQLAKLAGTGGWRSRVSDCRTKLGMRIENYQQRRKLPDGRVIRESFYRYVPPPQVTRDEIEMFGLDSETAVVK